MPFRNRFLASAFAVFVSASTGAAAQDQMNNQPPAPGTYSDSWAATKDTAARAMGWVSAHLPATTHEFVQTAAMSDMYEIAAANIALHRTANPDIRRFAHMMIQDHTQSTEKLKRALAIADRNIPLPGQFDDRHQAMINDLRGVSDRDFDRRYMDQQIGAHEEAKALLSGYARHGDNPVLRRFASDILPTVQMHLAMARTINNQYRMTRY